MTTNQTIDGVPLLPCPFCGELPVITKHFKHEMYSFMHRCPVIGPISRDFRETAQGHIDMWNTRVEQPEPVAVLPERLGQVLKFLDGAENLDGHWFGEPHPSGRPYWWRNELRKALAETNLFAKQQ